MKFDGNLHQYQPDNKQQNNKALMKKQQLQILNNVEDVTENNQVILKPAKTAQQRFFLNFVNIFLLRQKIITSNVQDVVAHQKGSFTHLMLSLKYMSLCMENKTNLEYHEFKVLKLLVRWMDCHEKLKTCEKISFSNSIFPEILEDAQLTHYEQLITYLNYIGMDLQKLIKKQHQNANITSNSPNLPSSHLSPEDLLEFLGGTLPKAYFNIILPKEVIQPETSLSAEKKNQKQDYLYVNQSLQYFAKTKNHYRLLLKQIFKALLGMDLKLNQMKELMELAFRYFYFYHEDNKWGANELFVQVFNKISEPVRIALSDEFILFFRIIKKLGGENFIKYLVKKSQFINNLFIKFNVNSVIGNPKDGVQPFNPLGIQHRIDIERGKIETRTFEIFHELSLFYFRIFIEDLDINIKLFYLGEFQSKVQTKKILFANDKYSGELKNAYFAAKKGIYMFQFDNSYSWIKNKTVLYQNVVLSPCEYITTQNPLWLDILYENIEYFEDQEEKKHEKQSESTISNKSKIEGKLAEVNELTKQRDNGNHFSNEKVNIKELPSEEQLEFERQREEIINKKFKNSFSSQIKGNSQQLVGKQRQQISKTESKTQFREQEEPKEEELKEQQFSVKKFEEDNKKEQEKDESSIIVQSNEPEQISLPEPFIVQANLTFIDGIFSFIVSEEYHTYQFQTNLEDRIYKKIKKYMERAQNFKWIVNSDAREWLRLKNLSFQKVKSNQKIYFKPELTHNKSSEVKKVEQMSLNNSVSSVQDRREHREEKEGNVKASNKAGIDKKPEKNGLKGQAPNDKSEGEKPKEQINEKQLSKLLGKPIKYGVEVE